MKPGKNRTANSFIRILELPPLLQVLFLEKTRRKGTAGETETEERLGC
jgi:hypothetical protein